MPFNHFNEIGAKSQVGNLPCSQCDQIGWFLKVFGKKILTKVAQMYGDFLKT